MPRQSTHQTAKRQQRHPAPMPITFICTVCGAVEHTATPTLPEGWVAEQVGNDVFAFCPDDAIDIPSGRAIQ